MLTSRGSRAAAGATVGLLLAVGALRTSTEAGFTATAGSPVSAAAGTVTIGDDSLGAAVLDVAGLVPGGTATRCIAVLYTGSLPSSVRLYTRNTTGTLGADVDVRIDLGTGGGSGDCTGFAPGATLFEGPMADLAATRTDHASGLAAFDATGVTTRVYRFTFTLRDDTASSQQGAVSAADVVWEARDTPGPAPALAQVSCLASAVRNGCAASGTTHDLWGLALSPDGTSLYAAGGGADLLLAYHRDAADGLITPLPGAQGCLSGDADPGCTAVTGLGYAHAVAVSPDGRTVYVTGELDDSLSVYSRDRSTGSLTQLAGTAGCVSRSGTSGACSVYGLMNYPRDVAVSPDGRTVYVTTNGESVIVLSRDASTGAVTPLPGSAGCVTRTGNGGSCGADPALIGTLEAVTVAPDGRSVYVGSDFDALAAFTRDTSTGALTSVAGPVGCLATTSLGGRCTVVPAAAYVVGTSVTPDGGQLLVAAGDALLVVPRDRTSGALAAPAQCFDADGSPGCTAVPGWTTARHVAVSGDGRSVYVPGGGGNSLFALDRDPVTGLVTARPGTVGCFSETGSGGACTAAPTLYQDRAVVVSPDGRHVYTTSFTGNGYVTAFSR